MTMRRVLLVNTADLGGGAERVAVTTLDHFNGLGTETWLAVGDKRTAHPRVVAIHSSPYFDYRPHAEHMLSSKLRRRRWLDRHAGLEDFNHPYSHHLLELTGARPDVVLCHNLHGGYFDLRALPALSASVPVVLRLLDSWLFTGHCAYPLGCARWETGCGRCPDLCMPPAIGRDATRFNWRRKRSILEQARVWVVTESQWIADRARRSLLAPAVAEWKVIPTGVDLDVFRPGDRLAARRELGLDPASRLLLCVANGGVANPFKDFSTLREAVHRLAGDARLVVVGGDAREEGRVLHVPYESSPERVARWYQAADVYVHAAHEETYGLSTVEAIACGTPVVTASEGGVREVVDDGVTGFVLPPRDGAGLASAVDRIVGDADLRRAMASRAAATARERYDVKRSVAELHSWCSSLTHDRVDEPAGDRHS